MHNRNERMMMVDTDMVCGQWTLPVIACSPPPSLTERMKAMSALKVCLSAMLVILIGVGCTPESGAIDQVDVGSIDLDEQNQTDERLDDLFKNLVAKDDDVERKAFREIVLMGSPCVDRLVKVLGDQESASEDMRRAAARALSFIGDHRAIPALGKAMLNDWSEGVRFVSACALSSIGDPDAVPYLVEALAQADKEKEAKNYNSIVPRRQAFESLGMIGDASAISVLSKHLINDAGEVDEGVAFALGLPRIPCAIHILETALDNPKLKKRDELLPGIARFGGKSAIRVLTKALSDKDAYVRYWAANYIGQTRSTGPTRPLLVVQRDPLAVPPLIGALQDTGRLVREQAAESLGNIGHEIAVLPLCALLEDSDDGVRAKAAIALGKIGDNRACPALLKALTGEEYEAARRGMIIGLGKLRSPGATKAIAAFADDKSRRVRKQVAIALSRIGDPKVVPVLGKMLYDEEDFVRFAAIDGLGDIGGKSALRVLKERQAKLNEYDPEQKDKLAKAIWLAGRPYTIEQIKEAASHKNLGVRAGAVSLLVQAKTPQTTAILKKMLKSENTYLRMIIKKSLPKDPWW